MVKCNGPTKCKVKAWWHGSGVNRKIKYNTTNNERKPKPVGSKWGKATHMSTIPKRYKARTVTNCGGKGATNVCGVWGKVQSTSKPNQIQGTIQGKGIGTNKNKIRGRGNQRG